MPADRHRPLCSPHAGAMLLAAALLAAHAVPSPALSQGWMKRVQNAATQAASGAVERKAEDAARRGTEGAVDAAARQAAGAVGAGPAPAGQAPGAVPSAVPHAASSPGGTAGGPGAAPSAAWANYDFIPGARPLFVEDFAADAVGDFPKRLRWEQGNYEVVAWRGGRYLRATTFGTFAIPLPEVLPERFTLEMDVAAPAGWAQRLTFGPAARGGDQPHVFVGPDAAGVSVGGARTAGEPGRDYQDALIPLRVMADGRHVKVYMGETRVANVPQVDLGRDRAIRVGVSASADAPLLVGAVRVMAGGRPLYDALAASGRVATQGVLFATGSDALRPESTPTLKEIAAMLAAHPALKLTVEGHTDDAGDAAANQALSARRAAAVKQALVAQFGADAARLEARGLGATKPVAPNATAEGRQANRRVELVRRS